jgi:hypothetical protein
MEYIDQLNRRIQGRALCRGKRFTKLCGSKIEQLSDITSAQQVTVI